jgi:3-deoxy-D-manno-octulosonate 8-phosphate phosphatase KdsC-like HAD superfamily phosphatase
MNGSTITIVESRTTSLNNRLEGLEIDILNTGNEEKRIDTSSIPLSAQHKTHIATNSAGEVKIWCDADKV